MARIIDGKAYAATLLSEVAAEVAAFERDYGLAPVLAVVLVGEDPASQVYVRNKMLRARDVGMRSVECRLPATCSQADLNGLVEQLNTDAGVHGILVQLPLPAHLDEVQVITAIAPAKDVDGFHPSNVGALTQGQPGLRPCTPQGCMLILQQELGNLAGKHAVVIGRSNIVGKPMAALLLHAHCTVTIAHSRTRNLARLCREADILVAAVGIAKLVRASWVKPGATLIDVGINVQAQDGRRKLTGDVDFDEVRHIAGAITPVPGGVGPMTIACLIKNTLTAARTQLSRNQVGIAKEALCPSRC